MQTGGFEPVLTKCAASSARPARSSSSAAHQGARVARLGHVLIQVRRLIEAAGTLHKLGQLQQGVGIAGLGGPPAPAEGLVDTAGPLQQLGRPPHGKVDARLGVALAESDGLVTAAGPGSSANQTARPCGPPRVPYRLLSASTSAGRRPPPGWPASAPGGWRTRPRRCLAGAARPGTAGHTCPSPAVRQRWRPWWRS
jgi:hypothetical protein